MRVILLGAPGAGKGTQAERLAARLGVPKLSTGEMVRAEIELGSDLGKEISDLNNSGHLVPDEIIIKILKNRLSKKDCEIGFVLDGFPRTVPQAEALEEILSAMPIQKLFVIAFKVDEAILVKRLSGRFTCKKCGAGYHVEYNKPKIEGVCNRCGSTEFIHRADDDEAAVRVRLRIYKDKTAPLIDYYKGNGTLREVNGEQSIEAISDSVNTIVKADL